MIVPFSDFNLRNLSLEAFLKKHSQFVIRAIPKTKDLPRRYKIGVSSFEACILFLAETIHPSNEKLYDVFLTEHEATNKGGAIISRKEDVLIEIVEGSLDRFSHGEVNPLAGGHFAFHRHHHFKSMQWTTEDKELRRFMWRALGYLRRDEGSESELFPKIEFLKGYFEFVITERTNSIKFLDYKINGAYLH